MKIKHKKLVASGTAAALAGVLGIGALLQTSVSVQASSAMMPGIEQIVSDNSDSKNPFKILEIVDSTEDAEIGYYISGQEPYIKLYTYSYEQDGEQKAIHFSSLQDGLEKLPNETLRREFATNVKLDENGQIDASKSTGIKDIRSLCGDSVEVYPLNYTNYNEKYFLDSSDNKDEWTKVDFTDIKTGKTRTDTVSINGNYRENSTGTGDYTKEEQKYYPIRKNVDADSSRPNKYRENIESFDASADGAQSPYYLEFEEVGNDFVNFAITENKKQNTIGAEYDAKKGKFGYYENVYADLTEEMTDNISAGTYTFPGSNPAKPDNFVNDSVPLWTNTSTQADAFNSGDEDEFTTVNGQTSDTADAADTASDFDSSQDNAFSDGDFSSGDDGISDTSDSTSADPAVSQNQSAQTTDTPVLDAENSNSDGTEGENTSAQEMLGKILNPKVQNTQSDPFIYLGENIDKYPYYKYTLVGDLKYVKDTAENNQKEDKQKQDNKENITRKDGDITLEDGQYWYWKANAKKGDFDKLPLSIVTGLQPVAFSNVQEIDTTKITYNYYYRVKAVYFCCISAGPGEKSDDFQYFGWYYPNYPVNEDVYLPIKDKEVPTYYISDAEYKLNPGKGEYDFIPGGDQEQQVQVNHMYYQGGYTNHDWFKRHVFHLSPKDSDEMVRNQFENFNIEVDTISAEDFNKKYGKTTATTSTVAPMVSEAGVELVSIENEINDNTASEFEDGSESETDSGEEQPAVTSSDVASSADFSDGENGDTNTFSAGNGATTSDSELSQYGLVYVNGQVNELGIQAMYDNSVPFVINMAKAVQGTILSQAVSDYTKPEDKDGHYVNKFIYFFKNTFATDDSSNLVNLNFNSNFNPDAGDNFSDDNNAVEGFEEILEYIESENQYRDLSRSDTATAAVENTDEEKISDGTEKFSSGTIDSLKKNLSQARAIEYIINYKYRRNTNQKQDIKVLEIMPDENCSQIDEETVTKWLSDKDATKKEKQYAENKSASANCWHGQGGEWYADPPSNAIDNNPATMWHTLWRSDSGYENCKNHEHYLEITLNNPSTINGFEYIGRNNATAGVLTKYRAEFYSADDQLIGSTGNKTRSTGITESNYQTIGKVTLSFGQTFTNVSKIRIYFSETLDPDGGFASCVQINFFYAPYTIYPEVTHMTASEFAGHIDDIGSEYDMIYIGDKKTDADHSLITGNGNLRYAHVGAAVGINNASTDNNHNNRSNLLKLLGQLDTDYLNNDRTRFAPYSTYNENGSGYFRGSGNDMTKQQYNMLMEFVKSGYPVILADGLVSGEKVNSKEVDSSSYYSQFISDALGYDNVYTRKGVDSESRKEISFFSNLAKPVIDFAADGKPAEPKCLNEDVDDGTENYYIKDKLEYTFTVKNDSDASPATTSYDCNLYIDLNFDGNFSKKENQSNYIEIKDSEGNVLSRNSNSQYELKIGKTYTLTRKIPSDYFKIIAWKLELTSNRNKYIHTSETGYAKQKGDPQNRQTINVVQLVPDRCTWTLKDSSNFWTYMNRVEDFQLNLKTVYVNDINDGNYNKYGNYNSLADILEDQQMLIIGFADVYKDINMTDTKAILNFIRSGRSVIFSHDTTSYVNYDYNKMNTSIPKDSYNNLSDAYIVPYDNFLHSTAYNVTWGLSLNTILRSVTGMDRYGITSDEEIGGKEIGTLLKQGNVLHDGDSVSFKELMELAGDVAYQQNDKTSSYAQTQGYSNALLNNVLSTYSEKATKVNDGAITQYPYKIGDTISIATTHGQYYQLALEQDRDINKRSDGCNDVVVWYCLPNGAYGSSTNDARNDYYFYSKGNVIYTGAGHSNIDKVDEIQLFINAIVAAANVTAVKPEVSFIKSLNPAAEKETTQYYTTDQPIWSEEANTLEQDMELYFNVKDYNMVSADLNQEDLDKQEMTVQLYIESADGSELTETDLPSVMSGKKLKDITATVAQLKEYNTAETKTVNVANDNKFHLKQNNAYGFEISNIEDYLRDKYNVGSYKNKKVYVLVRSKVYLYGREVSTSSAAVLDLRQRQLFELD